MSWKRTETFVLESPDRSVALARYLYDTGLLFLVNQAVLHHYGIALAIGFDDDDEITSLVLCEDDDPDGIWFSDDQVKESRQKLRAAGLLGSNGTGLPLHESGWRNKDRFSTTTSEIFEDQLERAEGDHVTHD